VLPLIDGGSHALDNLQTLCTPCHKAKTAEEARARAIRVRPPAAPDEIGPRDEAPSVTPRAPTRPTRRRSGSRAEEPLAQLLERASRVNTRVETMLREWRPGR